MLFGMGLAFFFGKPYPTGRAPPSGDPFGAWSSVPQVEAALNVNVLFLIGAALTVSRGGPSPTPRSDLSSERSAIAPMPRAPWATTWTPSGCSRQQRAACLPASAAPPLALLPVDGTSGYRPARADGSGAVIFNAVEPLASRRGASLRRRGRSGRRCNR